MARARGDGGQVVPLVAVVVVLAAIAVLLLGRLGAAEVARAKARTAADAVALAGAAEGRAAADRIAVANGAAISEWSEDGDSVTVRVVVGGQSATARAVRDCTRPGQTDLVHSLACPSSNPG